MNTPVLYGLPPIIGDAARVLILGNMPSVMSLEARQYYANPRNAFWRIMGEIFGFDVASAYEVRTATLCDHGVAVWDVLRSCRRVGSLDSAVEPDSMVANDFASLFDAHPTIDRVLFNGAAAEKDFNRLVRIAPDLRYQRLPSTSPAQTTPYQGSDEQGNVRRCAVTGRERRWCGGPCRLGLAARDRRRRRSGPAAPRWRPRPRRELMSSGAIG